MKYRKLIKPAVCMAVICCLVASDSTVSNAVRSISEIEAEQDSLQDEIDTLDADLYSLVSQITEIENAIAETEAEKKPAETQAEEILRQNIWKQVDFEQMHTLQKRILQAGLLAPTSMGKRPWEFYVIRDREILQKLSKAKQHGAAMLADCNTAIAVFADSDLSDAWIEDCSVVLGYMYLMAEEQGVGSCWVQMRMRKDEAGNAAAIAGDLFTSFVQDGPGQLREQYFYHAGSHGLYGVRYLIGRLTHKNNKEN